MPYRGAFVTHAGPIEPDSNTWSALLAVGAPCVASHETAVWLGAPERLSPPAKVHIGVLDGRRVNPLEGVVVHHLADLCGERVLWNAAPPRVRAEQATLDVVHLCRTDDAIVAAIAASVTARITTIPRLREQLSHRPRMRNRALVVDILADVAEGAESPLERRDLLNDRAHGLPGTRQIVRYSGKQRFRVDVFFTGDGLRYAVVKELNSRLWHGGEANRLKDMRRSNAAEERGDRTLQYGWGDIVGDGCRSAGQQIRVLRANGWLGTGHRCGPHCTALT